MTNHLFLRQGNLDFGAPRNRTYNELKRTNQGDHRRGRTKQFGRNENTEYGGGYGSPSHIQKKDWGVERHKTREVCQIPYFTNFSNGFTKQKGLKNSLRSISQSDAKENAFRPMRC